MMRADENFLLSQISHKFYKLGGNDVHKLMMIVKENFLRLTNGRALSAKCGATLCSLPYSVKSVQSGGKSV